MIPGGFWWVSYRFLEGFTFGSTSKTYPNSTQIEPRFDPNLPNGFKEFQMTPNGSLNRRGSAANRFFLGHLQTTLLNA